MCEVGIDITIAQPKILTTEAVQASDAVITMGCGDAYGVDTLSSRVAKFPVLVALAGVERARPSATTSDDASALLTDLLPQA